MDAFCEGIGFTPAQTARVFDHAAALGVPRRLHGDQLTDQGCGELAAKHGALSCDHCEYTSAAGAKAMGAAGVVAVLLPASNLFTNEAQLPPVAAFRAEGVPMAVATNCNPGSSPCASLLMAVHLACSRFRMTPEEALAGVTRHAAAALGRAATIGTLEVRRHNCYLHTLTRLCVVALHGGMSLQVGKAADLACWSCASPVELAYYMGLNPLVASYVDGKETKLAR